MSSYTKMEQVLQLINEKYNNAILNKILDDMIFEMTEKDEMFKNLFNRKYYGGSFYDDLKVGKANEYDLDLLFKMPNRCETHNGNNNNCRCVCLSTSNKPGYLQFIVKKGFYSKIDRFTDKNGYMQTDAVLKWLKGLIVSALNKLEAKYSYTEFDVELPKYHSESGPALTLRIEARIEGSYVTKFTIDLVPSFVFSSDDWPGPPYRANPASESSFFIVPKCAKIEHHGTRYWRLSFQSQETQLIKGKERLKPSLRLLKKARTSLGHHRISSYALKTIVLWETDINWNDTLSNCFMKLLKTYYDYLSKEKISYFWNKKYNLLDILESITLRCHANEIKNKINRIDREFQNNPLVVAEVILGKNNPEYMEFEQEYNSRFSNKHFNNNPSADSYQNKHDSDSDEDYLYGFDGRLHGNDPSADSYQNKHDSDSDEDLYGFNGGPYGYQPSENGHQARATLDNETNWGGVIVAAAAGIAAITFVGMALSRNRNNNNN